MKSIIDFINEKLIIKKSSKQLRNLDNIKPYGKIWEYLCKLTDSEKEKHFIKMKAYLNKGSKPQRLANSIKDIQKLIARWYVAILIEWVECALVFRDEIINRGYTTEDELDAFVLQQYTKRGGLWLTGSTVNKLEPYLNEVGVEYVAL